MAVGIYEWKQPAPKLPGVEGGAAAPKSPTDPMGAPTQGQSSGSMFGATSANRSAVGGAGSFDSLLKAGPAASQPSPSFNDLFAGVGEQRAQNVQAAQKNIAQGFQPQGPSIASTQARNQFQKAQDEAQRQVLEQAALAGRGETGQIIGDNRNFLTKQALPQAMDFEAMIQGQEEQQARQRSQDAMGNLLNLEGLGESSRNAAAQNALAARGQDITMRGQDIQDRQAQAQISQADRALAENSRQFDSRQEFERWATQQGFAQDAIARAWQSEEAAKERTSREGVAFAGLSLEERRLAQEASQFGSKLDFDRWATQAGLDQQTATRIWQSVESEKARASTEKIAFANLSLEERQLAQQAGQFRDELGFKRWATEGGWTQDAITRAWQASESEKARASTEKLAFADLSVREKELAQRGQQFTDELAFKKYATDGGWSQQEADRVWQASESERERASREKVSFAQLSAEEKRLAQEASQFSSKLDFDRWATQAGLDDRAADRIWQATESEKERTARAEESSLSRELQRYLGDRGFDIDEKKLAETVRQFDGKIAFDTWATQAGLDDNEKARVWQGHLQDLDRKWQTGERLGAQEHQSLIEDKRIQAQQAAQEFDRITQLDVLGKTQDWDREKTGIVQNYETLRANQQMSHEQAMQVVRGDIETKLTQMGIDAQAARQAADIEVKKWETDRQLAQQSVLANAELMFKYDSLREQTGLAKEELALKAQEVTNQVEQFYKSFGLEEKKVESLINSQEVQDAIGVNTLLFEMAGDNQDMIDFATEKFITSMGGMKGPDGNPLLSKQEVDGMIAELRKPAPPGPSNTWRTDDSLKRYAGGFEKILDGDIGGGAKDVILGGASTGLSMAKDAVTGVKKAGSAIASGVKKVFRNPFG